MKLSLKLSMSHLKFHHSWRVQLHERAQRRRANVLTLAAAAVEDLAIRLSNTVHSSAFRYVLTQCFLRFDLLSLVHFVQYLLKCPHFTAQRRFFSTKSKNLMSHLVNFTKYKAAWKPKKKDHSEQNIKIRIQSIYM